MLFMTTVLGDVDGELKVRYNDAYPLGMSKITNNIGKYTQVGRFSGKQMKSIFQKRIHIR